LTQALKKILCKTVPLGFARGLSYVWSMNAVEQAILQSLTELEEAVRSMPNANPKPNLLPIFSKLEDLTRQLPKESDPNLLHYLHKKSYEKARLWLQGRDAENARGGCRH
jgi:hypothetical protein